MKLSNKTYDILKWISLIALPALIAFYGVLGTTCNIPFTQETITIAVAANTAMGAMLGISTSNYNKTLK